MPINMHSIISGGGKMLANMQALYRNQLAPSSAEVNFMCSDGDKCNLIGVDDLS